MIPQADQDSDRPQSDPRGVQGRGSEAAAARTEDAARLRQRLHRQVLRSLSEGRIRAHCAGVHGRRLPHIYFGSCEDHS